MQERERSREVLEWARQYTPGGINTSIRAPDRPMAFGRANGSKMYDVDGYEYVDYHAAFGPIMLGHSNAQVNRRVCETLNQKDLFRVATRELEAHRHRHPMCLKSSHVSAAHTQQDAERTLEAAEQSLKALLE